MTKTIKIRDPNGKPLGEVKEKNEYNWRIRKTKVLDGTARVISPNLALYQYEKGTTYSPARYHVIHIPTGLVIAAVSYDLVKTVKESFESERWYLKSGTDNTFVLDSDKHLQWEFTCLIRYIIVESNEQ